MSNERMTNKKALEYVIENFGAQMPEDVKAKLEKMKEQAEKKASATTDRKPTEKQIQNEGYKKRILEVLTASGEPMSVKQIVAAIPEFADFENQKISALLTQLGNGTKVKAGEGLIDKKIEKGTSYFFIKAE